MWSDTLTFQAKDRTLRILDPRTDGAANETKSHDGIKDSKVNWDVRWCEVKITPWGNLVICTSRVGWEDGGQLITFGAQLWSGIPYAVVFAWFAFVNHQSDWWVCHQSDMWHVVGDLENDQTFQCTWFPQNSEFPWSQKIAVLFCTHAEVSLQWIQWWVTWGIYLG